MTGTAQAAWLRAVLVVLVAAGILVSGNPGVKPFGSLVVVIALVGLALLGRTGEQRLPMLLFAGAFGLVAIVPIVPLPLVGSFVVIFASRRSVRTREWPVGVGRRVAAVAGVGALAATGVMQWWFHLDAIYFYTQVPEFVSQHTGLLVCFVVVGSLVNAVFEEGFWRRHIYASLEGAGPRWVQVTAVALLFGIAHFFAIPGGWIGAGLTASFSVAASWLVQISGGRITLAVAAHAIADAVLLAVAVGLIHVP